MEVRVSRIISEYFECTRKEAEEHLREGRVKVNGQVATIGDKATIEDKVTLDEVLIPLKGIFRKVTKENAGKKVNEQFGKHSKEDLNYMDNPKSKEKRKGKKDYRKKRPSKFDDLDF
ncbi:S4 domain-containing protein [Porphyromonadaceae bacterium W3.11]|nr:S4 domain-containing protein [Porphyromonadaceae bacterium W3.11]